MSETSTELTLRDRMAVAAIGFQSGADAALYFESLGIPIDDNVTDGVRSLQIVDKKRLIGEPMTLLSWRFNESEKYKDATGESSWFVSVEFITDDGRQGVFNDGSVGIARELREISNARLNAGHPAPYMGRRVLRGLTASEYETNDAAGNLITATTYYLGF